MQVQPHLNDQPGLRGHSYDENETLTHRYKVIDMTDGTRQYVASGRDRFDALVRAMDVAKTDHIYEVVDSGSGPWPQETALYSVYNSNVVTHC